MLRETRRREVRNLLWGGIATILLVMLCFALTPSFATAQTKGAASKAAEELETGEEGVDNSAAPSQRTVAADESMTPAPHATEKDLAPRDALSVEGDEVADEALAPDDGEVPGDILAPVADGEVALEVQGGAKSFPDVPAGAWYAGVVSRAASLGLISGYSNGRFGPGDSVTRGQVAVILWNMAGRPEGRKSFPDVPSGAYYEKAVRWAGSAGVVSGYGNGHFGPNDLITREQLAVMTANYASRRAGIAVRGNAARYVNMADATSVSSYARTSMGWCFRNGVLSGTGNGYVNPKGNASRAEAAKMMVRLYEIVTKGEVPPSASDTWPYYELYGRVIKLAMQGSGVFSESYRNADRRYWRESIEYSLYDFGGDGVPELFVRGGTAALYMTTHVFTVRDGQVAYLGAYGSGHGSMAGTVGGELYYGGCRMGASFVERLRHAGGSFEGTTVFLGRATADQPDAEIQGLQNYYRQHGIRGFATSNADSYALLSVLM